MFWRKRKGSQPRADALGPEEVRHVMETARELVRDATNPRNIAGSLLTEVIELVHEHVHPAWELTAEVSKVDALSYEVMAQRLSC